MRALMMTAFLVFVPSCLEDEGRVRTTLENSGYSEIVITGSTSSFWSTQCAPSDDYGRKFRAKNPLGKVVEGVVCCGYDKGCTVRF